MTSFFFLCHRRLHGHRLGALDVAGVASLHVVVLYQVAQRLPVFSLVISPNSSCWCGALCKAGVVANVLGRNPHFEHKVKNEAKLLLCI